MCCSVLQCVAVRCRVLQCHVTRRTHHTCGSLPVVPACCSVLQRVPVCCSVLQCFAEHCRAVQSAAECYIVMSHMTHIWAKPPTYEPHLTYESHLTHMSRFPQCQERKKTPAPGWRQLMCLQHSSRRALLDFSAAPLTPGAPLRAVLQCVASVCAVLQCVMTHALAAHVVICAPRLFSSASDSGRPAASFVHTHTWKKKKTHTHHKHFLGKNTSGMHIFNQNVCIFKRDLWHFQKSPMKLSTEITSGMHIFNQNVCIFKRDLLHFQKSPMTLSTEITITSGMHTFNQNVCIFKRALLHFQKRPMTLSKEPYDTFHWNYLWDAHIEPQSHTCKSWLIRMSAFSKEHVCIFKRALWQFPLKMLHPQTPPHRETLISRHLAVQIQIKILV